MKPSAPFSESWYEMLQDPQLAASYLEEALADGDMQVFKLALREVAEARLGGMSALSQANHLNRVSLYRTLSETGNPSLETLTKVLNAVGLRISVTPQTPDPLASDETDLAAAQK